MIEVANIKTGKHKGSNVNSKTLALSALLGFFALSGCASHPDKIDAAYVSPLKYQNYDCDQLAMEMDYVGQRTTQLHQRLKKKRSDDNWQMGVGLLVFWPTLFLLEGGDGPDAAEYSQLKGEFEALRVSSVQRKCGLDDRLSPEEIMKEQEQAEI
jgi:hypothetical protein